MRNQWRAAAAMAAVLVLSAGAVWAQSTSAALSGRVVDPSGGVVVGAAVTTVNQATGLTYTARTNRSGHYDLENLPPGTYTVRVVKQGFATAVSRRVVFQVQAAREMDFALRLGTTAETVIVRAPAVGMDTTGGTVATVINRNFLENIPLNGRSIQTLLMLTPGVVFTEGGATNSQGQFSVNGQRTDANYFTVDGVAANLGTDEVGNSLSEAAAGSMPGFNALGGTNGLISVDAIQEFRVQTSSFAPEYGRTPGAQVALVSRAGTNAWHGSLFEYLRNNIFDAQDWFADEEGLPKPAERSNDFGGVFGGPIATNKTFFFFSYEGLQLRQPAALFGVVPDAAARAAAPGPLQPFLNAFPLPNGKSEGDDLADFNTAVSSPSSLNAYSLRLDQSFNPNLRLFVRWDYSPSSTASAGSPGSSGFTPNMFYETQVTTDTLTLGLDQTLTNTMANQFRANFSYLRSYGNQYLTDLGGAQVPTNAQLAAVMGQGVNPATAQFGFELGDGSSYYVGPSGINDQRQLNFVDNLSFVSGTHQMKFGIDYRWLAPLQGVTPYMMQAYYNGINGAGGVLSGTAADVSVSTFNGVSIDSRNLSLYAQDTWSATPRLTLTYGLRWDVNPAPQGTSLANDPIVVTGLGNPATIALAPRGTPLYQTTLDNLAPRLGVAYQLRQKTGSETVVRGGVGIFYDDGAGSLGLYSIGYPFRASNDYPNAAFPLTPAQAAQPVATASGPVGYITVADPDLQLPRVYQWNLAVQQALGTRQTVTATYLGSKGTQLLREYSVTGPAPVFNGGITVTNNSGVSSYNALQLQYQRNVARGLTAIASYTWSHSLDNSSNDWGSYSPSALGNAMIDYGSSDFDVRNSFSTALTYQIPAPWRGMARTILGGWSVQDLVIARSAFPVDLEPFTDYYVIGPYSYSARPNVVPGQPMYLYGPQYPGGKAFNPAAFTDAAAGTEGDLARNTLRGFGAWQDNFAVHRDFSLSEGLKMQFRAEAFNVLNHPNFADPPGFWPLNYPTFGVATGTLAQGLTNGSGDGLNALYQIGAPRSLQFGLKLSF